MDYLMNKAYENLDLSYLMGMIRPLTCYGELKKREMKFFKNGEESILKKELDELDIMFKLSNEYKDEFKEIKSLLKFIKEIRGSLKRSYEGIVLDEVELFEIKNFILGIRDLCFVQDSLIDIPKSIELYRYESLENLLDVEGHGGRTFYIYDSYSKELSDVRRKKRELLHKFDSERKKIMNSIEELLGVRFKLSFEIILNKSDEKGISLARECQYLIEGTKSVVTASYKLKLTDYLESLKAQIEELKDLEEKEEYKVRMSITNTIQDNIDTINDLIDRVGKLDFLIAKVDFISAIGGTRPTISKNVGIALKDGRNIKLEEKLKDLGKEITPLSFNLDKGVTVITGANMGGKTLSLKLVGICTALAQMALFVPAIEFETSLFDYIYFSMGDNQSIDSGLSSFGGEIKSIIDMLNIGNGRGLILIDELARGTNPSEGYAITRSLVRYFKNTNSVVLFTTHYDGITEEIGIQHLQVRGLKNIDFEKLKSENNKDFGMDFVFDNMDYSLERVDKNQSVPKDAINIARLMGLNNDILRVAEDILMEGDKESYGKA